MGKVIGNKHWVAIAVNDFNNLVKTGPLPGNLKEPKPWDPIQPTLKEVPDSLSHITMGSELTEEDWEWEVIRLECMYDKESFHLEFLKLPKRLDVRELFLRILIEGVFESQLDEGVDLVELVDRFHDALFV